MAENLTQYTEDDIYAVGWGFNTLPYLLQLINGEWPLEEAREGLASLVGSEFDSRVKGI